MKSKIQNSKTGVVATKEHKDNLEGIRISVFGFLSSFVIRHSGFCALFLTYGIAVLANRAPAASGASPMPPAITFEDFKLTGDLSGDQAVFILSATARVEDSKGCSLELLSGTVALTEVGPH